MTFDPAPISRPNPIHPDHLTAAERLSELASLLARGVVRLHHRQSSHVSAHPRENALHYSADQSGHAAVTKRRTA
jgi:hypothetical protein